MQDAQWALEVAMSCCVPHQVNERESDMRAVKARLVRHRREWNFDFRPIFQP